jgi:hypothetical protein
MRCKPSRSAFQQAGDGCAVLLKAPRSRPAPAKGPFSKDAESSHHLRRLRTFPADSPRRWPPLASLHQEEKVAENLLLAHNFGESDICIENCRRRSDKDSTITILNVHKSISHYQT